MILNDIFRHSDGEVYTVTGIGPMGSGKFFGKQLVQLRRERDGAPCYVQVRNGRLHHATKVRVK